MRNTYCETWEANSHSIPTMPGKEICKSLQTQTLKAQLTNYSLFCINPSSMLNYSTVVLYSSYKTKEFQACCLGAACKPSSVNLVPSTQLLLSKQRKHHGEKFEAVVFKMLMNNMITLLESSSVRYFQGLYCIFKENVLCTLKVLFV